MITVTNRRYETVCQLTFDLAGGLIADDDWLEQDLDTGIATYEFTVEKDGNPEVEKLVNGNYVFVPDGDIMRGFEIVNIEQDNDSKTLYCEDGGLDLLGETVWPLDGNTSRTLVEHFASATLDSGWEIGVNEVPSNATRKIKAEGFETAVKRLRRIAKAFDVEMNFSYEFVHGKIHRKLVNFYKRIGKDKKVRLEYGPNVSKITKKESIEHLATALRGHGSDGITLKGYTYDDGRYWVGGDTIHDRQEGQRWSRHNNIRQDGGYIVDTYESQAKSQQALFNETMSQLKKRAYPEAKFEVDIDYLPENVNIGDSISIIDNEYQPALQLEARISKIKKQLSNPNVGKVTITNIVETPDSISEKVQRLSVLVKERLFDFTEVPFIMNIHSTDGVVFQNSNISTKLIANVSKMDITMTNRFSYRWKRVSKYGDTDVDWNKKHETASNELVIGIDDVNKEATFICEALENNRVIAQNSIVIKDFIVNKSIGPTAPKNPSSGDLWTDTSNSEKEVPKIFTNGEWQPILKKDDKELERLQKEFEERNREQANNFTKIMEIINKNEIGEDTLRDLTGRFSNLESSTKELLKVAERIEGLGARTKAIELSLEQSQVFINTMSTYFSISEDGLLIGKNGEKLQNRIANDRMEFIDGGRVVAYIAGQQLNILSATFWNSVTIANHIFERFNNEFTTISYVGSVNGNG